METKDILINAKKCTSVLASLNEETKNSALLLMADSLIENSDAILKENSIDVENARGIISDVMIDRLTLTSERIFDMAEGIRNVAKLPDPINNVLEERTLDNGIELTKVSVPMGVVAIIYESRPNVTSDAAALCFKSGNVVVLRGGKEAYKTNKAVVNALKQGLIKANLCEDLINIIDDITRQSSLDLMKAHGLVDLLIPRGGAGLIKACVENATVPCIETGTGICHIYVDEDADLDMATNIIYNAKTSRPSVCNAEEVLLVNSKIANEFLPKIKKALVDDRIANNLIPVELRLCDKASKIIDGTLANENDFDTEFLDYILAIKVIDCVEDAVDHVQKHSTHHSDAIISNNQETINYFASNVDSAVVYVNASTRFTDGGVFGLGCEMGISTQKLHARGPMGLKELTSYKYILKGNGQIR